MIINELAYRVTVKTDEFLNGKRKVQEEVSKLNQALSRSEKEREKELKKQREELEKFSKSAATATSNVMTAAASFLGLGAGLYGIKQLFTSTSNEIVRASTQAKFFGSDVNKLFGMRRGFQQAGLNADAFIGASGNARMALANIKDPTIFGGLTGAAQNLITLGARTGLDINQLGDPNKALAEFTRYGKGHSHDNLMQVMAAAGFDPTDAAKIKSGELKQLVDSETKKSNITAAQVKEQEKVAATLGQLDSELSRLKQDLAIAFAPDVINGMKEFSSWIEKNHGNITGFFDEAGKTVKRFTDAVGGAENALTLLAAAYVGSKTTGMGVPPWLAGLIAYGTYLYNDQNNIKDSAESSLSYTKRNIGDAARAIGFDTDYGRKPGHVMGDNIQWDIPGATETLLDAIRKVESSDGAKLYSPKGAVGEYQFMADTGREMGLRVDDQVDDRLDPEKSRAAAQIYMSKLLKKYDGNLDNALMAYNWGMGNVDKWIANGSDPAKLPKETKDYTGKIRSAMGLSDANNSIGPDRYRDYYATQARLANGSSNQSYAQSVVNNYNSQNIGEVKVSATTDQASKLAEGFKEMNRRASTSQAFSSSVK
ncbi:lytic transglycosylase domain-containing protein [Escherichia coli]|uniref:lytic transglycosylase domain-containing protein n=1 Tax=Escherichia coli TaxID=562 RepID=UPI002F96ADC1